MSWKPPFLYIFACKNQHDMTLSELKTGEKGVIVKVLGHGSFRKRIVEMGFIKGTVVEVLLNAPLQDPVKYKLMGYEVSLRHDEANMVEIITEAEPGVFQITFMNGNMNDSFKLRIIEYAALDRFPDTIKNGWHRLDEATLRHFGRGTTDGAIWFESDKMREWLTDFGPESMSDLVLLNALYWPDRIQLFPEFLRRKLNPDEIPSAGNEAADRILRDTYGILLYQEQALMLQEAGYPVDTPFKDLALKGHFVARTMLAVEAIWPRRMKTSLR